MLSEKCINGIATELVSKIDSAEVVLDGEVQPANIIKKEANKNFIKVFINITQKTGTITDIRLKDEAGDVLISKPQEVVKDTGYALVSSFYIQIVEEEAESPVSVFELAKEGRPLSE